LIMLAKGRAALGSLDRVKRMVKVLRMVNSAEGFGDPPRNFALSAAVSKPKETPAELPKCSNLTIVANVVVNVVLSKG